MPSRACDTLSVRRALGVREPVMRVKFAFQRDLSSCLPAFISRRALQVGWTILYSYLRLWMGSFEINSTDTSWLHKHMSVRIRRMCIAIHRGLVFASKWRVRHPGCAEEHRPQGAGCGPNDFRRRRPRSEGPCPGCASQRSLPQDQESF